MTSASALFLMNLKSTTMQDSSEISIVQDNANSSHASLSKFFFDGNSSSDSLSHSMTSRRRRMSSSSRGGSLRRSRRSRWNPAAAGDDENAGIPTRQGSLQDLMADESARSAQSLDSRSIVSSSSGNAVSLPNRDSRPRIPRRQTSFDENTSSVRAARRFKPRHRKPRRATSSPMQ